MDYILSKIIRRSPTPSKCAENHEIHNIFAENILESLNVVTNQSQIAGTVGSSQQQQQNSKLLPGANKPKLLESENQEQLNSRNNNLNKTTENGKVDNYDGEKIKQIDDLSTEEAASIPLPDIVNTLPSISLTNATKLSNSTNELTSELYIDTADKTLNEEEHLYLTPKISDGISNTSSEDETFKECQSNLSMDFDQSKCSIPKFENKNLDICIQDNDFRKQNHTVSDSRMMEPETCIEKVECITRNEYQTGCLLEDERKPQVNTKWNVLMAEAYYNDEDINDSQIDMNVTPPSVEIDQPIKTKPVFLKENLASDSTSLFHKKDIEVELKKADEDVENNKLSDSFKVQSFKTIDASEEFDEKAISNVPNLKECDSTKLGISQIQEKYYSQSDFHDNKSFQIISSEQITTTPIFNQLTGEREKIVMNSLETSQNENPKLADVGNVHCIVANQLKKIEQLNGQSKLLSCGPETEFLDLNNEITDKIDAAYQNKNLSYSSVEPVMPDFQTQTCNQEINTPILNEFDNESNVTDFGGVNCFTANKFIKTEQLSGQSKLLSPDREIKSLLNNEFTNKTENTNKNQHLSHSSVMPDFQVHNYAHNITASDEVLNQGDISKVLDQMNIDFSKIEISPSHKIDDSKFNFHHDKTFDITSNEQISITPSIFNEFKKELTEKQQDIFSSEKQPTNIIMNSLETPETENLSKGDDFKNEKYIEHLSPKTFVSDATYKNQELTNFSVESAMTKSHDSTNSFEKKSDIGNHIDLASSFKSPEKKINHVEEHEKTNERKSIDEQSIIKINYQVELLESEQASTVFSEENKLSSEEINSNNLENSAVTSSHEKDSMQVTQKIMLDSSEIMSSPLLEKQFPSKGTKTIFASNNKNDIQLNNANHAKNVENLNNFHLNQQGSTEHVTQTELVVENHVKESSPMTDSIEMRICNSHNTLSIDSEMFDSLEMQSVSEHSIQNSEDIESRIVYNIATSKSLKDSDEVISSKSEHIIKASSPSTNLNETFQFNLPNLKNDSIKASEDVKIKSINNVSPLESLSHSDNKVEEIDSKAETIIIATSTPELKTTKLDESVRLTSLNLKNDLIKNSEEMKMKTGINSFPLESVNENDKLDVIELKSDQIIEEFSTLEVKTTDLNKTAELKTPNLKSSMSSPSNLLSNTTLDQLTLKSPFVIKDDVNETINVQNDRSDKFNIANRLNCQINDNLNRSYDDIPASDLNTAFYSQNPMSDCGNSLNNEEIADKITDFQNFILQDTVFKFPQKKSNYKKSSPPKIAEESFDSNAFILSPGDFDYLLTKGCNSFEVNRNSILLKFDPLVGKPVLANQQQQSPEHHLAQKAYHTQNIRLSQNEQVQKLTPLSAIELKEELCGNLSKLNNKQINIGTDSEKTLSSNKDNKLNERKIDNLLKKTSENQKRGVPVGNFNRIRTEKGNVKMSVDVIQDLKINNLNPKEADEKLILKMEEQEKKVQNDSIKSEELEKKLKETEQNLKQSEQREEALLKRITEKDKTIAKLGGVIEAYEKAIAEAIAEKEQITQNYEKQLQEIQNERDLNSQHLASLESTFTDLHLKYERSKLITAKLKTSGEELLAERNKDLENLRLQEQRYEKMKNHALQQLEIANNKLEFLTKNQTLETAKVKALLKKEEISKASIHEQLQQKCRENDELMKICDELINGGQNS